jgi:hypothetical protein
VFLNKLGGVEKTIYIDLDGDRVNAEPEHDVDRTSANGKAIAVQFLHFAFTDSQSAKWLSGEGTSVVRIDHPEYGHGAIVDLAKRSELSRDFRA